MNTCKDCKYFEVDTVSAVCEKKRWICDDDAPACNRFEQKPTLFDTITESPETLAEKLVFEIFCKEDPNIKGWTSAFTDVHETREEAIAATVAKLKEACND